MKTFRLILPVFVMLPVSGCVAQTTTTASQVDLVAVPDLAVQAKALLAQAKAGNGSASTVLGNYNGHKTMLSARTSSGVAEQHMHFADFLIVLDGEGTELTGGTMVDRTEGPDGENKGTKLEGATAHALHKGDVIHIPAGMPHQAIEAPGQTITAYVIKVQEAAH